MFNNSFLNYSTTYNATGTAVGIRVTTGVNISIIGNYIRQSNSGGFGFGIYLLTSSTNNYISENSVNTSRDGIFLDSANSNTITNNNVSSSNSIGLSLSSSNSNNLSSNRINTIAAGGFGIQLGSSSSSNIITRNTITTEGSSAMGVDIISTSSSNRLEENTINTSGTSSHAVQIRISSKNNNVTNNSLSTYGSSASGVSIFSSATGTRLDSNNITTSGLSAIAIQLQANSQIIINNTVTTINNSASGIVAGGVGFSIISNNINTSGNNSVGIDFTSSSHTISSNNIATAGPYSPGVRLNTISTSNTFSSNIIATNGTNGSYGIELQGSASLNTFNNDTVNATNAPEFYSNSPEITNTITGMLLMGGPNITTHEFKTVYIDVNQTAAADPPGKRKLQYNLTIEQTVAGGYIDYNLTYLDADLSGIIEDTIRINKHNGTDWAELATSTVDTTNNVVRSGNITSFSLFAPLGNLSIQCGNVTQDTYLMQNITVNGTCFVINASSIDFKCADGIVIMGNGSGSGFDIFETNDVQIDNCVTENFHRGWNISNSFNIRFNNDTSRNNTGAGFYYTEVNSSYLRTGVTHNKTASTDVSFDAGIFLDTSNNISIFNSTVENSTIGIRISGSNNTLEKSTVTKSKSSGADNLFPSSVFVSGIENTVRDNNISLNNNTDSGATIILIGANTFNNTVVNNTINDNIGYGIRLQTRYSVIENNTIINNSMAGISMLSAVNGDNNGTRVANNTIRYNGASTARSGIEISSFPLLQRNIHIINNTIEHNLGAGIYHLGGRDDLIENNTVRNNSARGIVITSTPTRTSTNVTARNNIVDSNGVIGIQVGGPYTTTGGTGNENNTLDANTVSSHTVVGVMINSSNLNLVVNSTINDNSKGVKIINSNNVSIINNQIPNSIIGIDIDPAFDTLVSGNTIDNGNIGVLINNSNTTNVSFNTIQNNIEGILITNNASSNVMHNNSIFTNSRGLNITSGTNNVAYFNNFTGNTVKHITAAISGNFFNTTDPTFPTQFQARGNTYDDLPNLAIYDENNDQFGDFGAQHPYSTSLGAFTSGFVEDFGPWPVPNVNLSITKQDSPDPVASGNTLTYTIVITNGANTNATVHVIETYPSGFVFSSATPFPDVGNNQWFLTVQNMSSATITITGIVTAPPDTILTNAVNATQNLTVNVTVRANATTLVVEPPVLPPGGGGGGYSLPPAAPPSPEAQPVAAAREVAEAAEKGLKAEELPPTEAFVPVRLEPGPTCAVSKGLVYLTLALGLFAIIGITLAGFLSFKKSSWLTAETLYLIMAANAGMITYVYMACDELLFYAVLANAFISMTNFLFAAEANERPLQKLVKASEFIWQRKKKPIGKRRRK
ncbi:right-handed parallel beta-helix repeat-containing protein [Candidatus Woesearchaeota archaeon]|nr:right-handed parallel beta-helix repeat-containing protein [Candidatus Woesearchaeota archaeon]